MKKRGQISVFIILGLVVLIGVIFLVYLSDKSTTSNIDIKEVFDQSSEVDAIDFYIRSCVKNVAEEAFFRTGWFGGKASFSPSDTDNYVMNPNVPGDFYRYLFRKDSSFVATLPFTLIGANLHDQVSNAYKYQVQNYLLSGLGREDCVPVGPPGWSCSLLYPSQYEVGGLWQCLDDFRPFRRQGWNFEYQTSDANIEINFLEDKTDIILTIPIIMKKDKQSYRSEEFKLTTYTFSETTILTISSELDNIFQILIARLEAAGLDFTNPNWISYLDALPVTEPADISEYGSPDTGSEGTITPQTYAFLIDDDFMPNPVDYTFWIIKDTTSSPNPHNFYFITSMNQ